MDVYSHFPTRLHDKTMPHTLLTIPNSLPRLKCSEQYHYISRNVLHLNFVRWKGIKRFSSEMSIPAYQRIRHFKLQEYIVELAGNKRVEN